MNSSETNPRNDEGFPTVNSLISMLRQVAIRIGAILVDGGALCFFAKRGLLEGSHFSNDEGSEHLMRDSENCSLYTLVW